MPRRLSFSLSLDENVRAKEGGKETTGETAFRPPSVPFPWSLAAHHQSLTKTKRLRRRLRLLFAARYENFAVKQKASIFVSYVIKKFAHTSSCAYLELWMQLKSLESLPREAKVAIGCASSYSYAFSCSPNFPRASIIRYTHAKREQILKFYFSRARSKQYASMSTWHFFFYLTVMFLWKF